MNAGIRIAMAIAAASFLAAVATVSMAQQPARPVADAPKKPDAAQIQYDPPKRGAPKGRVGGGTRGVEPRELSMAVIAPDHPGLSSRTSPKLYWFLSRPINAAFEVSVIEDGAADALIDRAIPAPKEAGVQVLDLAAMGVVLQPEREYRWFISLISNPNARSGDTVASGKVIWEPLPANVKARVESADAASRPGVYAASGYWYDAYAELRALRERNPGDRSLREMEVALIGQVGLRDVVHHLTQP